MCGSWRGVSKQPMDNKPHRKNPTRRAQSREGETQIARISRRGRARQGQSVKARMDADGHGFEQRKFATKRREKARKGMGSVGWTLVFVLMLFVKYSAQAGIFTNAAYVLL